jgi:hypothetical protein
MRGLLIAVIGGLTAMPALAQQTLPQGAVVKGNLTQPLSSKSANVGDGFTLVHVGSQDGSVTGATIYGHVAAVQRAGTGHPGQMQLAFDRIQFADGTSTDVRGQTISMSQKQQGSNPAVRDAIGAVGGMIVGNIIGKWIGTPTNVGGLAGAAGGFLIANNMHDDFSVPSGSTIGLRLSQPIVRPQSGGQQGMYPNGPPHQQQGMVGPENAPQQQH